MTRPHLTGLTDLFPPFAGLPPATPEVRPMSLSARAKRVLKVALADPEVGTEIAAAVDAAILAGGDPLGLAELGNAMLAKTGTGTSAARTITGTANQVTVTNGTGVSGNPTISLPVSIDITTSYKIGGTKVVGAQGSAITALTATASSGTLPTPNNAVTISDATTPTVVELLEFCVELNSRVNALRSALSTHGLTA